MNRDWVAAKTKVEVEAHCRVCNGTYRLDPAHIIPRSRVGPPMGDRAENIVPLCRVCHRAYDDGHLDLLPCLTREEQSYAVLLVGLIEAFDRLTPIPIKEPA